MDKLEKPKKITKENIPNQNLCLEIMYTTLNYETNQFGCLISPL